MPVEEEAHKSPNLVVSAYDVTVFIRGEGDAEFFTDSHGFYERASSAKVGEMWGVARGALAPEGLGWGRKRTEDLGFFGGTAGFQKHNWEGVMKKACARLSSWKWLLHQLSYRGRVLLANNLVASTWWHRLIDLQPPRRKIQEVQKPLVDSFWSGQHWIRAAALYLPLREVGGGSKSKIFECDLAKGFCSMVELTGWTLLEFCWERLGAWTTISSYFWFSLRRPTWLGSHLSTSQCYRLGKFLKLPTYLLESQRCGYSRSHCSSLWEAGCMKSGESEMHLYKHQRLRSERWPASGLRNTIPNPTNGMMNASMFSLLWLSVLTEGVEGAIFQDPGAGGISGSRKEGGMLCMC